MTAGGLFAASNILKRLRAWINCACAYTRHKTARPEHKRCIVASMHTCALSHARRYLLHARVRACGCTRACARAAIRERESVCVCFTHRFARAWRYHALPHQSQAIPRQAHAQAHAMLKRMRCSQAHAMLKRMRCSSACDAQAHALLKRMRCAHTHTHASPKM